MKITNLKDYLCMMIEFKKKNFPNQKWPYSCFEDFVFQNGRSFTNHSKKTIKRGKMKECFMNAYRLAESSGFIYVEGFAISSIGFPVLHAWCIDSNDNVYDPTWSDGKEYFGVPFKIEYVLKTMLKRKSYGVIDNFECRFPLISGVDKDFKKGGN